MDELLTVDEVATALRVSPQTVRWWVYAGTGPVSVKVGRWRRFRRADIEAWLTANTSTTVA